MIRGKERELYEMKRGKRAKYHLGPSNFIDR